jgi:hypothetical protein
MQGNTSKRDGDGRGQGSPTLKRVLVAAGDVVVSVGSRQDLHTHGRLGACHNTERMKGSTRCRGSLREVARRSRGCSGD